LWFVLRQFVCSQALQRRRTTGVGGEQESADKSPLKNATKVANYKLKKFRNSALTIFTIKYAQTRLPDNLFRHFYPRVKKAAACSSTCQVESARKLTACATGQHMYPLMSCEGRVLT
jgi:hypothetical protein